MWAAAGGGSAGPDGLQGRQGGDAGSVAAAMRLAEQQTGDDEKESTRLVVRTETAAETNIDVGTEGES